MIETHPTIPERIKPSPLIPEFFRGKIGEVLKEMRVGRIFEVITTLRRLNIDPDYFINLINKVKEIVQNMNEETINKKIIPILEMRITLMEIGNKISEMIRQGLISPAEIERSLKSEIEKLREAFENIGMGFIFEIRERGGVNPVIAFAIAFLALLILAACVVSFAHFGVAREFHMPELIRALGGNPEDLERFMEIVKDILKLLGLYKEGGL